LSNYIIIGSYLHDIVYSRYFRKARSRLRVTNKITT